MIKSFSCQNCSFDEYMQKVSADLSGRKLGNIVSVSTNDANVKLTFKRMGTSEVNYALKKNDDNSGFECTHQLPEKIALTHKALRNEIESRFVDVLKDNGATVEMA